jgi:hypothetical protein
VAGLTPTSLSFANQASGTASAAQNVTLTNVGTGTLSITGASLSDANAGDFTLTNSCGSTLAQGASCTISVKFAPMFPASRSEGRDVDRCHQWRLTDCIALWHLIYRRAERERFADITHLYQCDGEQDLVPVGEVSTQARPRPPSAEKRLAARIRISSASRRVLVLAAVLSPPAPPVQ